MNRRGKLCQGMANICFDCKNAVPDDRGHGCPWSRKFEPVEGWTAEIIKLNIGNGRYEDNYHITACPLFDPDSPEPRKSGVARRVRCKETGVVYETLVEAAKWAGVSPSTVATGIKRGGTAGGYNWEEVAYV